jgi:5-methylcytosine-specific restriction protein A
MAKPPWIVPKPAGFGKKSHSNGHIYHSTAWRKDRAAHLLSNPLCVECNSKGLVNKATVSDHILPIEQGGDVWDWNNRQALCQSCHNSKSASESHKSRKGGRGFSQQS